VRIALVVPRSMDDDAVRSAAIATYRDLVAEDHEVDCFLVADPRGLDGFGVDARTRLCVVDHEFRAERWSNRSPALARVTEYLLVRVAALRLRRLLARANRRVAYDAFIQPRWQG
jgi:hypothetical protein